MIQKIRILQNENQQLNGDLGGCGLGPEAEDDDYEDGCGVLGELSTSPMSSSSRDLSRAGSLCHPAAAGSGLVTGGGGGAAQVAAAAGARTGSVSTILPRYDRGAVPAPPPSREGDEGKGSNCGRV